MICDDGVILMGCEFVYLDVVIFVVLIVDIVNSDRIIYVNECFSGVLVICKGVKGILRFKFLRIVFLRF